MLHSPGSGPPLAFARGGGGVQDEVVQPREPTSGLRNCRSSLFRPKVVLAAAAAAAAARCSLLLLPHRRLFSSPCPAGPGHCKRVPPACCPPPQARALQGRDHFSSRAAAARGAFCPRRGVLDCWCEPARSGKQYDGRQQRKYVYNSKQQGQGRPWKHPLITYT